MKKLSKLFLFLIIPTIINYGWGDNGHKLITKHALKLLPSDINFTDKFKASIIEHSIDPDYRKKEDPSEPNKHFIDIDYYKEFLNGEMIISIDSLKKIYGDSIVTAMGILPWATTTTYSNLVEAFKSADREKILLYISDLSHYVEDGHQPLHSSINYNGQLTMQKGIHFRYEIEMIDKHLDEIDKQLKIISPVYVSNITEFVFNYIFESNFEVDILLTADKIATKFSNGKFDDGYYKLLWFRTKNLTIDKFEQASFSLASLIYSAWIDAGKPKVEY